MIFGSTPALPAEDLKECFTPMQSNLLCGISEILF